MKLPTQKDFTFLARQLNATKELTEPQTINATLSSDTKFATFALCSKIIGPLKEEFNRTYSGKLKSWTWEGLESDNLLTGYLSHNGTNFRFQTKIATILDLPFNQLKIEPHPLGLLVTTPTDTYAIGNFTAINKELSPKNKMSFNFGAESVIWMRELGSLGVVDLTTYNNSRSKAKLFTIVWFVFVGIVSVWLFLSTKK